MQSNTHPFSIPNQFFQQYASSMTPFYPYFSLPIENYYQPSQFRPLCYQMSTNYPTMTPYSQSYQQAQFNIPQIDQSLQCFNQNPINQQDNQVQAQTNTNCPSMQEVQTLNSKQQKDKNEEIAKQDTQRQVKRTSHKIVKNRRGHWTNEEHYRYLKFVRQNKELFQTSVQKKLNRVFKMMSIEIPTRTACQCRSHYSKFNPFDPTQKVRRKLVNDEEVYEKMFEGNEDD